MKTLTDPILVANMVGQLAADHLFTLRLWLEDMCMAGNYGSVTTHGGLNGDLESVYAEMSFHIPGIGGMFVVRYIPDQRKFRLDHSTKRTIFGNAVEIKAHLRELLSEHGKAYLRPL